MQLKNYEAASIQEAMTMIRKELGEDAVILSTNRKGNGFEVVAARDHDHRPVESAWAGPEKKVEKTPEKKPEKKWIPEGQTEIGELREAVKVLFDLIGGGKGDGDRLSPLYYRLLAGGMSRAAACSFAEKMHMDDQTDACEAMKKVLPVYSHRKKKRIRALIGPTGAGKTTTLAKLAAETAFGERRSTAIITMDTHRIAATEQIRIYAKIMDLPMVIAADKIAYETAIARFADKEVIYVDTPGRSHRDIAALESMSRILHSGPDTELSLVLSMASTREHLLASARQYDVFGSDQIIFTKLDECTKYGAMVDVMEKTGLPVSYWTTGQNVPDDIEKATPQRIAELILGR